MLLVCHECTPKVGIASLSVQKSSIRPVAATLNRSSGHVCCILNRSLRTAVLYCVLYGRHDTGEKIDKAKPPKLIPVRGSKYTLNIEASAHRASVGVKQVSIYIYNQS